MNHNSGDGLLFNVLTPMGIIVRTSKEYWNYITSVKHPILAGELSAVIQTLQSPEEIRQSRSDDQVYLFYRSVSDKRWVCTVVKREDYSGFLVSAYPTDKIKRGIQIWKR